MDGNVLLPSFIWQGCKSQFDIIFFSLPAILRASTWTEDILEMMKNHLCVLYPLLLFVFRDRIHFVNTEFWRIEILSSCTMSVSCSFLVFFNEESFVCHLWFLAIDTVDTEMNYATFASRSFWAYSIVSNFLFCFSFLSDLYFYIFLSVILNSVRVLLGITSRCSGVILLIMSVAFEGVSEMEFRISCRCKEYSI